MVAVRSIVPGDTFADLLMRLAVPGSVLRANRDFPACLYAVVVDDTHVVSYGRRDAVAREASAASPQLVHEFEDDLGLEDDLGVVVKTGKILIVASDRAMAAAVAASSKRFKKAARSSVRNVGVDLAGAKRVSFGHRLRKMREVYTRASRVHMLGKRGISAARVGQAAFGPSSLSRAAITGVSLGHLKIV